MAKKKTSILSTKLAETTKTLYKNNLIQKQVFSEETETDYNIQIPNTTDDEFITSNMLHSIYRYKFFIYFTEENITTFEVTSILPPAKFWQNSVWDRDHKCAITCRRELIKILIALDTNDFRCSCCGVYGKDGNYPRYNYAFAISKRTDTEPLDPDWNSDKNKRNCANVCLYWAWTSHRIKTANNEGTEKPEQNFCSALDIYNVNADFLLDNSYVYYSEIKI